MEKIQRFGIRNPVEGKEGKESPEMFRASLGFDFIFTTDEKGVLHCVCIEINGHDSGVVGVQEIPKGQIDTMHKTVAGIRATEHPEMARKFKIANEVLTDIHSKEFTPSPEGLKKIHGYMKKSLKTQPTFSFAYQNPDFIEDMTRDKRIQERYIPEEYRPRTWHPGDNPSSPTGAWVVKYYDSRGGDDVHVVPNEHFPDTLSDLGPRVEKYVIQEWIPSAGAQMMPESVGRRAASMRLLMDFRYLSDGSIVPDFVTAYQRVALYDFDQEENKEGDYLTNNDLYVVNRHRGSHSVRVSPEEMELGKRAAEAIIQNIARVYKAHLPQEKNARVDSAESEVV